MSPAPEPHSSARQRDAAARWPHRLALCTALCAVPLVLFGGSVTTLGAGMAVDGWLVAEGHFLLFFPVEKWFRDTATFVEHTHRLFGVLVGLCALATVAATWSSRLGRGVRWASIAALAAITGQGALGGLRVLEASPELAFLHGACAQAVFAALCALVLCLSPAWRSAERPRDPLPSGLRWLAWATPAVVFAQVVLGALYRHGLRPVPAPDTALRLALHLCGAFVATAFVVAFALSLVRHRAHERAALQRAHRLGLLLALQVVLGLSAWAGQRPDAVGPLEWAVSVLHVLGGALLLAECVRAAMLTLRSRPLASASAPARLEVAR